MADERTVTLDRWTGPWPDDDPDANFKSEIALYAHVDPMTTLDNLAANIDVPVGAIVRYVLARWGSGGSGGILEIGPSMINRLAAVCDEAEETGTDEARLAAYDQLRQMVQWLQLPLKDDSGY